jgi:hypothetical protein
MGNFPSPPDDSVQVDLYADGVFDDPSPEAAVVKVEYSAWIDPDSRKETSFARF